MICLCFEKKHCYKNLKNEGCEAEIGRAGRHIIFDYGERKDSVQTTNRGKNIRWYKLYAVNVFDMYMSSLGSDT